MAISWSHCLTQHFTSDLKSDNARVAKNASSRKLLSNLKEGDASQRIVPMAKQNMALLSQLSSLKVGT
jgi:hypothetical protein